MLKRLFRGRGKDAIPPKSADFDILEKKLEDPCATPISLPLDFLKSITRDFSEEEELGRGGFGVVYKGGLRNGKLIAVKKLLDSNLDNDQFHREITYLIEVKHENIVQLMGYCAESRSEAVRVSGKYVMAEKQHRLICFECLTNKSLDKHLSAESSDLEWHIRYEIIKGICRGLHYLHNECHIIHLDLKPENILMDGNMVPKIADFGMSRLFGQQQSRIVTNSFGGTFGYMAPEYLTNGLISTKSDIFSLGVIIMELLIGSRDYPKSTEACFEQFIENVVNRWRKRLEKSSNQYTPLEIYCEQVNACIKIGMKCVDPDRNKRPPASDILEMLNAIKSTRCSGVKEGRVVVDKPAPSGWPASVLPYKTKNVRAHYRIGKELGRGQFAITYQCVGKADGVKYACKSIWKSKMRCRSNYEDVYREIQIMHHLSDHPNVVRIHRAYEDARFVHIVMELCTGGDLFHRIVARGHYSECAAAKLIRTIVGVVEECHSLGVAHRDLKPENFLFATMAEDAPLKVIDFGLSTFYKPGDKSADLLGSAYYVASQGLHTRYGPEVDVWSAGMILYIMLSGVPTFLAENESGIFHEVLHGELDFESEPWPSISDSAKDLVRNMLTRDPTKRFSAHEVLCHPWVVDDAVAPGKPIDSAVL